MIGEIREVLSGMGARLGFASDELAWVYVCCILAVLLCVLYSLGSWVWAMGKAMVHGKQRRKKHQQTRRIARPRKRVQRAQKTQKIKRAPAPRKKR